MNTATIERTATRPAFSTLGARPAGVALHSSNHATSVALSAWK